MIINTDLVEEQELLFDIDLEKKQVVLFEVDFESQEFINIDLEEETEIQFDLDLTEEFEIDFSIGTIINSGLLPFYQGPWEVTPHPYNEQILPTDNTSVLDDIVVFKIPYSEVSNPQGGLTVNIGGL